MVPFSYKIINLDLQIIQLFDILIMLEIYLKKFKIYKEYCGDGKWIKLL